MEPALSAILLVFAHVVLVVLAGFAYLGRFRVERPPVGVLNLRDVAFAAVVLVVVPPLYLRIPRLLVGAILVVVGVGVLSFTLGPLLGRLWGLAAAAALVAVDVALALGAGGHSAAFLVVNNLLVDRDDPLLRARLEERAGERGLSLQGLVLHTDLAEMPPPEFFRALLRETVVTREEGGRAWSLR